MNPSQLTGGLAIFFLLASLGYLLMQCWRWQARVPIEKRSIPLIAWPMMALACFAMGGIVLLITLVLVR